MRDWSVTPVSHLSKTAGPWVRDLHRRQTNVADILRQHIVE